MPLKLTLDGKELGTLNTETGDITDTDGNKVIKSVEPTIKPNQMTVPLVDDPLLLQTPRERRAAAVKVVEKQFDGKSEPTITEPNITQELKPADNLELQLLRKHNEMLERNLQQMSNNQQTMQGNKVKTVDNLIPDGIDDEKDPFGIARTVKSMAEALDNINTRVNRLDQFQGFSAYQEAVETAKVEHKEIFTDSKVGPIAERLLTSELKVSSEPMEVVVARVAREIRDLGYHGKPGDTIKKVAKIKEEIPPVLRSGDVGLSPAITVDKPKDVKSAGQQYRAWRAARDKFNAEGR